MLNSFSYKEEVLNPKKKDLTKEKLPRNVWVLVMTIFECWTLKVWDLFLWQFFCFFYDEALIIRPRCSLHTTLNWDHLIVFWWIPTLSISPFRTKWVLSYCLLDYMRVVLREQCGFSCKSFFCCCSWTWRREWWTVYMQNVSFEQAAICIVYFL